MIGITWMEIPDVVVTGQGKLQATGAFPVLNDDDECVGLVFTGLPPNVMFKGHFDVDMTSIDRSYFVRLETDQNGVAHLSFNTQG